MYKNVLEIPPTKMNFKSSAETEHWSPAFDIPGHEYTESWFSV